MDLDALEQVEKMERDASPEPTFKPKLRPIQQRPVPKSRNDFDLLTSLASALNKTEKELHQARQENEEKTRRIAVLEKRIKKLQDKHSDKYTQELEQRCEELEAQMSSMQTDVFPFDIETIRRNIHELNISCGIDTLDISKKNNQAQFQSVLHQRLLLFKDGIFFRDGPFRSFEEDPSAYKFLSDIEEGYFPSELKRVYPDGFVFDLSEHVSVSYSDYVTPSFQDQGHLLETPSRRPTLESPLNFDNHLQTHHHSHSPSHQHSHSPSHQKRDDGNSLVSVSLQEKKPPELRQETKDAFLAKIPNVTIRNGQVIDIKSDITKLLETKREIVVIDLTTSVAPSTKPTNVSPRRSFTKIETAHLKIQVPGWDNEIQLKMHADQTIQDLMDQLRPHVDPLIGYDWEHFWNLG
ncbi:hypothetical protein EDD86DRAFT_273401 [Gorgonomyces haynaldii]|nr:hypothetical protein EDD86DRAFT_273401 [Gorgonomyces haynaldii]